MCLVCKEDVEFEWLCDGVDVGCVRANAGRGFRSYNRKHRKIWDFILRKERGIKFVMG